MEVSLLHFVWAIGLGLVSAVSLPLGAWIGIRKIPQPSALSILAAFGAGALFAALTIELVAPKVMAIAHGAGGHPSLEAYEHFFALLGGLVIGGVLFVALDQLVNAHGGFLRKTAATLAHLREDKRRRMQESLEELSKFALLRNLSPEHINVLVEMIRPVTFYDGEKIVEAGDRVTALYLLKSGTVRVVRDAAVSLPGEAEQIDQFTPGDVIGLLFLLTDSPTVMTAKAVGTVEGFQLTREDFGRLRQISPEFDLACRELAAQRLEQLEEYHSSQVEVAKNWVRQAGRTLRVGSDFPSELQLRSESEKHSGAPLAIWLGILIDGIPESIVIGAGLADLLVERAHIVEQLRFLHIIPYTLIAGLFLSNFPEALSSAANMRKQGMGNKKIMFMWTSLMILTGIGAGLGFLLGGILPLTWIVFTEGGAAGAMLTMIASAMIPEAVHLGSPHAVGLSTLSGFLSAIVFKLLE
jgi:CRP-like cAMP-binding protein